MSRAFDTSSTVNAASFRPRWSSAVVLSCLPLLAVACGNEQAQTANPPNSTTTTTVDDVPAPGVGASSTSPAPSSLPPASTSSSSVTPVPAVSTDVEHSSSAESNAEPTTVDRPDPTSDAETSSATSAPSLPPVDASSGADTGVVPPASDPSPSPGCGASNANVAPPTGTVIQEPDGYDGTSPVPVLFAFHGAGGNASSLQGPFASDAKSRGYLGVYLKSSGSAWSIQADTPTLDAAYDAIVQNYCVDLNRLFAVGHSSGAQMITQLLCAKEDRFRAVAPVASSKYCNGWDATAAIVIHGVDDIERGGQGENRYGLDDGDGHIDFGVYRDSNECTEAATAFDPGGNCGANIDPGCVEYDACSARTVFCNHNDPQYGTSNHGVPCFASKVMFDFFDDFQ